MKLFGILSPALKLVDHIKTDCKRDQQQVLLLLKVLEVHQQYNSKYSQRVFKGNLKRKTYTLICLYLAHTWSFQIINTFHYLGYYSGYTFSTFMRPSANPNHQLHFICTHSPSHSVTCSETTHYQ